MTEKAQESSALLNSALQRYQAGWDPTLIELPERAVFPHLISAQPSTARKSRGTGMLLGKPAPRFIRRGRNIRYRLVDVLDWLKDGKPVNSTAEASMKNREDSIDEDNTPPTVLRLQTGCARQPGASCQTARSHFLTHGTYLEPKATRTKNGHPAIKLSGRF